MSVKRAAIDQRAIRTRNRIASAVIRLGSKRGVDSLTVGEIAREAGISRSTFYAHFGNLEQYFAQSFSNMLASMVAHAAAENPAGSEILPVRKILEHVAGAPDYVAAISRSKYRPKMFAAGEERLTKQVELRLAARQPDLAADERAAAARFIAAGFLGLLRGWMEGGMRRPREAFERDFAALTHALGNGPHPQITAPAVPGE